VPFISHNERVELAEGKPAETVGQLCYLSYIKMVEAWNAAPRWTTAHAIYKDLLLHRDHTAMTLDQVVAADLAWQVFMFEYVYPYELKKKAENGSI